MMLCNNLKYINLQAIVAADYFDAGKGRENYNHLTMVLSGRDMVYEVKGPDATKVWVALQEMSK